MVSITKRKMPKWDFQDRKKRLGLKNRTYYRVKNVAGETLQDFPIKSQALRYKKKLMKR